MRECVRLKRIRISLCYRGKRVDLVTGINRADGSTGSLLEADGRRSVGILRRLASGRRKVVLGHEPDIIAELCFLEVSLARPASLNRELTLERREVGRRPRAGHPGSSRQSSTDDIGSVRLSNRSPFIANDLQVLGKLEYTATLRSDGGSIPRVEGSEDSATDEHRPAKLRQQKN